MFLGSFVKLIWWGPVETGTTESSHTRDSSVKKKETSSLSEACLK